MVKIQITTHSKEWDCSAHEMLYSLCG